MTRWFSDVRRRRLGRGRSVVAAAAVAILSVGVTAPPSAAAPGPDNDDWEGATAIALAETVTQDTTQATTDAFDAELNEWCGAPYTNASVWYSYTPGVDGLFVADMSESDYTGGFMAFEGEPSLDTMVDCSPTTTGVYGTAGTTYYLMVFSDTEVNGGNLVLTLREGPPPPTLEVTVDPVGRVLKDGSAVLTGMFTCTNSDWVDLELTLSQRVGRFKVNGYGWSAFEEQCDGEWYPWEVTISSDSGLYAGGRATISLWGWAYGPFETGEASVEQTVRLTRAR